MTEAGSEENEELTVSGSRVFQVEVKSTSPGNQETHLPRMKTIEILVLKCHEIANKRNQMREGSRE
jgi:hypothetical protein